MVSFTKSRCPQLCFSASVSSDTFKGDVSIFSIGVDKTAAVPPQPRNKTAKKADVAIVLIVLMVLLELVIYKFN